KNPEDWRWSQLHVVAPQHPVLGADVPAPLQWFANPGPVGVGGGSSIVNATGWDAGAENDGRRDYSVTAVPSMRMVVDLGDLDRSLWVNFTGVSGHPASAYYSDQLEAWAPGRPSPGPSAATPSRRPRGRPAPCAPPAADRQATPPGGGGQAPAEKEEPVRRNHRSSVMTASTGWSCSARGSRSSVMSSASWTMAKTGVSGRRWSSARSYHPPPCPSRAPVGWIASAGAMTTSASASASAGSTSPEGSGGRPGARWARSSRPVYRPQQRTRPGPSTGSRTVIPRAWRAPSSSPVSG